jgi:hypothetical protein
VLPLSAGALLELAASLGALFAHTELSWSFGSAVPYLNYAVRLDPLSAYLTLALSLRAAAVSGRYRRGRR